MKRGIGTNNIQDASFEAFKKIAHKNKAKTKFSKERIIKQQMKVRSRSSKRKIQKTIQSPKRNPKQNSRMKIRKRLRQGSKSKSRSKSKSKSRSNSNTSKKNTKKINMKRKIENGGSFQLNEFMSKLCYLLEEFKRISKKVSKRNKLFQNLVRENLSPNELSEGNNNIVILQGELIENMTKNYTSIELTVNKIFLSIEKYLFGRKPPQPSNNDNNISISNLSNKIPKGLRNSNESRSFNINIDHKPSNFTVNHNIFTPNFADIDVVDTKYKEEKESEKKKKRPKKTSKNLIIKQKNFIEETSSEFEHYEITPKGMCDSFDVEQASKDMTLRNIKINERKEKELQNKTEGISEISKKDENFSSYNNTFGITGFIETKTEFSLPKKLKNNIQKISENENLLKISEVERLRLKEIFEKKGTIKPFSTLQVYDEDQLKKESDIRIKKTIMDIFCSKSKNSTSKFEE